MLKELPQPVQILWALNIIAGTLLVVLLTIRRNYRVFPAFSLYILVNLAGGISAVVLYTHVDFFSRFSWRIAWGMQAVVFCARTWAVMEICKRILSRYRGVWALAWRVLLACAAFVMLYSGLAARRGGLGFVLPKAERALEFAIAAVIVGIFFFARYYAVEVRPVDRSIAIGFFLYSSFMVIDNTVLERFLNDYVIVWNLLAMLAFFASLTLWSWALRKRQPESSAEGSLLPSETYYVLNPEINMRLQLLNDHLSKTLRREPTRQ